MTTKPPGEPLPTSSPVPPQVRAALEYLNYVKGVLAAGLIHSSAGVQVAHVPELDIKELRTRDAALEVVRGYMSIAARHIAGHEEALEHDGPTPAPTGKSVEN